MFKGINQYVIPLPDGRWGVCSGSRDMHNPVLCFDAMDQAVDYARQAAIQFESEVLLLSGEQLAEAACSEGASLLAVQSDLS